MLIPVLTVLVVASATLCILAEYRGPRRNVYLFKPLTIVLIILIALLGEASSPLYKFLIIAGLLFSLGGDIFLMLPSDKFLHGLLSFLVAHLCYIAAFTTDGARPNIFTAIPLLLYGGTMLLMLWPHLGRLRVPVVIYMLVILLMVWQAWNRHISVENSGSMLALVGASLFAASDSVLALNRFRKPFRAARFLILSTYFAAQWLIALSLWKS